MQIELDKNGRVKRMRCGDMEFVQEDPDKRPACNQSTDLVWFTRVLTPKEREWVRRVLARIRDVQLPPKTAGEDVMGGWDPNRSWKDCPDHCVVCGRTTWDDSENAPSVICEPASRFTACAEHWECIMSKQLERVHEYEERGCKPEPQEGT